MGSISLTRFMLVIATLMSIASRASASTYQVWLGYMEAFSAVSNRDIFKGNDSDYLSLAITLPNGDTQTYASPEPAPLKDHSANNRFDFNLIGDRFMISPDQQVTIGWSAINSGTSNHQLAARAASDLAEKISVSTGNPIAVVIGTVLGQTVDWATTDCDMVLFQQRIRLSGADLDKGLESFPSNPQWSPEGPNQWHNVFGPYDFKGPGGSCHDGRYNLEVHIKRIDDNTLPTPPAPVAKSKTFRQLPVPSSTPDQTDQENDFAYRQLISLYRPLSETLERGDLAWKDYNRRNRAKYGPEHYAPLSMRTIADPSRYGGVGVEFVPIPKPEFEDWVQEMHNNFTPLNKQITDLITLNRALWVGPGVPECFIKWFAYMNDYKAAEQYIRQNPSDTIWYSSASFPKCLQPYVEDTKAALEKRAYQGSR